MLWYEKEIGEILRLLGEALVLPTPKLKIELCPLPLSSAPTAAPRSPQIADVRNV